MTPWLQLLDDALATIGGLIHGALIGAFVALVILLASRGGS